MSSNEAGPPGTALFRVAPCVLVRAPPGSSTMVPGILLAEISPNCMPLRVTRLAVEMILAFTGAVMLAADSSAAIPKVQASISKRDCHRRAGRPLNGLGVCFIDMGLFIYFFIGIFCLNINQSWTLVKSIGQAGKMHQGQIW